MEKLNQTPTWLHASWVNLSDICFRLYGSKSKGKTSLISQKRKGDRNWLPEELAKLEEIRQEILQTLINSK